MASTTEVVPWTKEQWRTAASHWTDDELARIAEDPTGDERECDMDDLEVKTGTVQFDLGKWLQFLVIAGGIFIAYGKSSSTADMTRLQVESLSSVVSKQADKISELAQSVAELKGTISAQQQRIDDLLRVKGR